MPSQIDTLNRLSRAFMGNTTALSSAFRFLAKYFNKNPYDHYFLMNTHPNCKDILKLGIRTQIFPRKDIDGSIGFCPIFMLPKDWEFKDLDVDMDSVDDD
jgi:hypothetical protein